MNLEVAVFLRNFADSALAFLEIQVGCYPKKRFWVFWVKKLPLIFQYGTMRRIALIILLYTGFLHAQNDNDFVDEKYLEDQLYFNLTYIQMLNTPDRISQSGFSFGLGGGFIKDFPINKRRNVGLGLGLGYGLNNYYFNLQLDEGDIPGEELKFKNNKIILHAVELPIELRFRGSTASKYKFWRFYPGIKIAYSFAKNTNFSKSPDFDLGDYIKINDFLYGVTFSAGYNKWNLHLYYGLNELFNESMDNPYAIDINDIRVGLIFYMF